MRIYQAGPLFTAAELAYNKKLAIWLRSRGHEVFLPQEIDQTTEPGYAARIFAGDVTRLDRADAVVAVLDGSDVDSGTAWECGFAYAKGKPIYGIRTDFRILGPEEKVNLMIQECCIRIFNRFEHLMEIQL
jgi:nucleoside 2-deoxyribosyltransferase